MTRQNKVSGVVLAGGQGRRMGQQDKGLVMFRDRPLISYALTALAPLVDELLISANRNIQHYQQFGYRVLTDATDQFDGPLAGVLAAMEATSSPVLLVMACDVPFLQTCHLQGLLTAVQKGAEIAVADDGERLHPVVMALQSKLKDSLQAYLETGQRKLQVWQRQHRLQAVDFSATPQAFVNLNSLDDLMALENAERQ